MPAHRTYLRAKGACFGLAASLKGTQSSMHENLNMTAHKPGDPAACLASQLKEPDTLIFSDFGDEQGKPS